MGLLDFFKPQQPVSQQAVPDKIFVDDRTQDDIRRDELRQQMSSQRLSVTELDEFAKSKNGKPASIQATTGIIGSMDVSSGLSFRTKTDGSNQQAMNVILRRASRHPIIQSIIDARNHQLSPYGQPARYADGGVGFEVFLKDREPGEELRKKDKKAIFAIEDFIDNLGERLSPNRSFRTWLMETIRDCLIFGYSTSELIYLQDNLISFRSIDAGTMYIASDTKKNRDANIAFVQQTMEQQKDIEGIGFEQEEIMYGRPNPTTALNQGGYGVSPLEAVLDQLQTFEVLEEYNRRYFTQGGTTRGILQINPGENASGAVVENFKRDWADTQGMNGAHKIPVVIADDVKFVPMNESMKDMESEKQTNYLINVISSAFSMDPAEIGFPNKGGSAGSSGGSHLQEASKKEASELSQARGLKPLLDYVEDLINRNIMPHLEDGRFRFRFTGNKYQQQMQDLAVIEKELQTYKTVAEVRSEKGYDPEDWNFQQTQFNIAYQGMLQQKEMFDIKREDDKKQQEEQAQSTQETPDDVGRITKDGQATDETVANKFGKEAPTSGDKS